jgi:hypothetical protein
MAGKAKSVYLTVHPKGNPLNAVLRRTFFDAKAFRDFIESDDYKAKYPSDQYVIVKEVY